MNHPVKAFLQHHHLTITTLSVVHLGCDEEYDPSNYVISDDLLFSFDSANLMSILDEAQRKKLNSIVDSPKALLAVQKFIHDLRGEVPAITSHVVKACSPLAAKYRERIGKTAQTNERGEQDTLRQMAIPRTAYDTYAKAPVLTGTALKGAMRTAILNARNANRKHRIETKPNNGAVKNGEHSKLEKSVLSGSFESDPLRLIKVADAKAAAQDTFIDNKVLYDSNLSKKMRSDGKQTQAISVMREVISELNSLSFETELVLQDLLHNQLPGKTPQHPISTNELIEACNQFYRSLLRDELTLCHKLNCLDKHWLNSFESIKPHLFKLLDTGKAILLRIGRHSGAEGVTIKGARHIKIMGKRGEKPQFKSETTTLWLASEREKSTSSMIPFGWILLEIDRDEKNPDSQAIAQYCREYHHETLQTQQRYRSTLAEKKQALIKKQQTQQHKQDEARLKREKEAQQQAQEQQRKAAMTPEQLKIEEVSALLNKDEAKNSCAGGSYAKQVAEIVDQAKNWNQADKDALLAVLGAVLAHLGIDKKSKAWKPRLQSLKG